jgi:hypothetical protein
VPLAWLFFGLEYPGRAREVKSPEPGGLGGSPAAASRDFGDELRAAERAEWLVADLSLARAFFTGVPIARLLARTRLASDEEDMSASPLGVEPYSRWDALMKALLGRSSTDLERVKRNVARQARAASDEGPLPASPGVVAVLAYACAGSKDSDASMAEGFSDAREPPRLDPQSLRAVAAFEPRVLSQAIDPRAPLFEACVRLAARGSAGPWPMDRIAEASRQLATSEARFGLVLRSDEPLFPRDLETEIPIAQRRMVRLDRAALDALVARDPRELAAIIARTVRTSRTSRTSDEETPQPATARSDNLDSLLADLGRLLASSGALLLAAPMLDPTNEGEALGLQPASSPDAAPSSTTPRPRTPSWLPMDWSSSDAGAALADAFERGATTQPRIRAAVARGGEPALDAIGAEMLRVGAHPFASAAFAEILARSGRTRDIARLVTYFAIAPDPAPAARALSLCSSPELQGMLMAWLEAMLPHDGGPAPDGADPSTSSAARLRRCIAALAPYPHLYHAVRPLLSRVSMAPPPA